MADLKTRTFDLCGVFCLFVCFSVLGLHCGAKGYSLAVVCGLGCFSCVWDPGALSRDLTHAPCTGRQILNPWSSREVPQHLTLIDEHSLIILQQRHMVVGSLRWNHTGASVHKSNKGVWGTKVKPGQHLPRCLLLSLLYISVCVQETINTPCP